jgi:hypothetical protein
MNTYRTNARIIGVLFLVALVFTLIASSISDPILSASDYLNNAYPNKTPVIIGGLLNLICALAMIFIPIILYPIAKRYNANLAVGYVVFRFLEGILYIYLAIQSLTFISLSKAYIGAGGQNASYLQTLGNSVQSENHWTMLVYITIYALGAITFYSLLYTSKLVPRFLSVWGILATVLILVGAMLGMFSLGIFSSMPLMEAMKYFAPPVALNELVLSIWLIAKGFNSSAATSESAIDSHAPHAEVNVT